MCWEQSAAWKYNNISRWASKHNNWVIFIDWRASSISRLQSWFSVRCTRSTLQIRKHRPSKQCIHVFCTLREVRVGAPSAYPSPPTPSHASTHPSRDVARTRNIHCLIASTQAHAHTHTHLLLSAYCALSTLTSCENVLLFFIVFEW